MIRIDRYNTRRLTLAVLLILGLFFALIALGVSWWMALTFLGTAYCTYGVVLHMGDRREAAIIPELLTRIGKPIPREAAYEVDLICTYCKFRKRNLTVWIGLHEEGVILYRAFEYSFLVPSRVIRACRVSEGKEGAKWWMVCSQGDDSLWILDVDDILLAASKGHE